MKKILFIIAVLISFSTAYGQDKTAEDFKKEGKEAYKAKDYKSAYTAFYEAIVLNKRANVVDTALYYNAGYCAYKSRKYAEAADLFDRAIALNYKKEKAYLFAGNSYKKAGNKEKLISTLDAGLKEFPDNAKMKKLKASQVFRKGLELYNQASTKIQAAATLVESDPERYKAEKAEADRFYRDALPHLEKAYELNPTMKNLPEALIGAYEALDMKDKAEEIKNSMKSVE